LLKVLMIQIQGPFSPILFEGKLFFLENRKSILEIPVFYLSA